MAIPEEDRGPSWLRDYGYTDFGDIAADIAAMEEFATKLAAEVELHYAPHMTSVSDAMRTVLPTPSPEFQELGNFLEAHRAVQVTTHENVYNFATGTSRLASAAKQVGQKYGDSDAFANATVKDVNSAFRGTTTPEGFGPTSTAGDA